MNDKKSDIKKRKPKRKNVNKHPKKLKYVSYSFSCQGTWKFMCAICGKKYYKMGHHAQCYKQYCGICDIVTESKEELIKHAKLWHKEYYCDICENSFQHIKEHETNYHGEDDT